jgi:hypothetical protein
MKTKNLLILVAIVIAVGAYLILFERHRPTTDEAKKEAEKVFQGFDRDEVSGIVVDSEAGRIRLEKVGDEWRLREPLDFAADESTVSSALGALENLTADRRLPVAEVDLAEYGLAEPKIKITVRMAGGGESVLAIGDELPLGSNRGLRLNDGDEIVVASGWFVSNFEREVDDWRSHDVVKILEDQVASIDIESGDDSIRAVHLRNHWQLMRPLDDLADSDHLRGLVSDLASMRIEEFLDSDVDIAALGLAAPEYEITVVRSDGGDPLRLDLGATREGDGGTQVACRRGDGEYFWATDRVRTRLSKAPVLWRSKKVAPFDTWNVNALHLSGGDGTSVSLERADGLWSFVGDDAEADQTKVRDRLSALAGLEATDYDLTAPLTAEMGRAEVTLGTDDDTSEGTTIEFVFYPPLENGGRAMVRASGRSALLGVDAGTVDTILGSFDDLRSQPTGEAGDDAE